MRLLILLLAFSIQVLGQVCVKPAVYYPLLPGYEPQGITTGDFNNDGKIDIATSVPNYYGTFFNKVGILFGDGLGGFGVPTYYTVGSGAMGIVSADFNLDGKPDLATVNNDSNSVSILLNSGSGSFLQPFALSVFTDPVTIVKGDFNNDGKTDIATLSGGWDKISILLGIGNGSFNPPVFFSTAAFARSMDAADFNKDGNLDLVTCTSSGTPVNVSIYLGTGTGTIGSAISYTFSTSIYTYLGIVAADFNKDNNPDVSIPINSNEFCILLGDGLGNLSGALTYTNGLSANAMISDDFNGDGNPDIATSNSYGDISLSLGSGTGSFNGLANYVTGNSPYSLTSADFNGDLKPDIAVANSSSYNISVFLNTARPVIQVSSSLDSVCVDSSAILTASGAFTYTWVNGPTNASFTTTQSVTTTYVVIGTDANTCKDTANFTLGVFDCLVGVSEIAPYNLGLSIYPLPAKDQIYLESSIEINSISIYDVCGRFILNVPEAKSNQAIDVSGLSRGMYYLVYKGGAQKIIKE